MSFAFLLLLAALSMLAAASAAMGDARAQAPVVVAVKAQAFRDRRTGASPPRR
jgi:hypothetical protein